MNSGLAAWSDQGMEESGSRTLLVVVILVGVAAGAWLFRDLWMPGEPPPPPPPVEPAPAEPAPTLEPLYPVAPIEPRDEGGELVPLPPLEDSDEYFALALVDLFGPDLEELLADDLLIERAVGTVDNLGRGRVPERIRPVGRLPGSFVVEGSGEDTGFFMSPRNYERYNDVVAMLEQAPVGDLVDTYRRFYPLLNEAYRLLGYPDGHFSDRAVEIIDLLLATPEPDGMDRVRSTHREPVAARRITGPPAWKEQGDFGVAGMPVEAIDQVRSWLS